MPFDRTGIAAQHTTVAMSKAWRMATMAQKACAGTPDKVRQNATFP
jgi:hypothetical protein